MKSRLSFFEIVFLILLAVSILAFFHGLDEPAIAVLDRHYLPGSFVR